MYFTEAEIKQILKSQEDRLRKANSKTRDLGKDLISTQHWLRKHYIEMPEALEIAIKKQGNGVKVGKKKLSKV